MSEEKTMKNTEQKIPALRFPEFSGEWEEKKLGKIAIFISGFAFSSELFGNSGYKLITPKNFTKYGYADFTDINTKYTTEEVDDKLVCREGDLLVLLTDLTASCELLGKPILLKQEDGDVLLNQRIVKVVTNESLLIRRLLKNILLRDSYHKRIVETATGTTVRHSSNKILSDTVIAFPSLPEQQKIADFLSAVDTRLQLLKDKKTKLEEYKRGVMQRIFSQELRFTRPDGSAYPDWEEKRIGDVFTFKQGVQCPVEEQSLEKEDDRVRFIRIIDLTSSNEPARYIRTFNQKDIIKSNDLFMVRYGTPGLVGYGFEGVVANNLFRLIPVTDVYNKYYYYVLLFLNKKITSLASSSTMPALNFKSLGMLEIPEPHLDEQRQIADFLSAIDDKISLLNQQIASTEQYKKGLLQQMFV